MTTPNASTSITPQPSGTHTTAPDPGHGNGNGNGNGKSDSTAADAVLWIELLLHQFPELLVELAPSYRSPSA
ncbi:hypothetical protein HET64_14270, partial [Streptomyces sp. McG3]|nr:hypothetical protein [Streptomyces sp. McG3]